MLAVGSPPEYGQIFQPGACQKSGEISEKAENPDETSQRIIKGPVENQYHRKCLSYSRFITQSE